MSKMPDPWRTIDRIGAAQDGVPKELTMTFDGDNVHCDWYDPQIHDVVCGLCGKKCREQGKSPCTMVNPFCG